MENKNEELFFDQQRLYPAQLSFALHWIKERKERVEQAEIFYLECLARPNTGTEISVASRGVHQRCLRHTRKVLEEGVFGVLEILDEKENIRQFAVGSNDVPDASIISAWHPAAKIFYHGDFEEYFEIKLGNDTHEVSMESRAQFIQKGFVLKRGKIHYDDDVFHISPAPKELSSVPEDIDSEEEEGLLDIRGLLTSEQYRQISTAHRQPLIIQGKAGSGKTTVGLYRLSFLAYTNKEEGIVGIDPRKLLIITYNIALNNYVKSLLSDIGLDEAALFPFHTWADQVLKRAYNGKIQKLTDSSVRRVDGFQDSKILKDQVAVLAMLDEHVAFQQASLPKWLEGRWTIKKVPKNIIEECLGWFTSYEGPFLRKIIHMRSQILAQKNMLELEKTREKNEQKIREKEYLIQVYTYLYNHIKTVYANMSNYKRDMRRIFCNVELMQKHFPEWTKARLEKVASFNDNIIRRSAGAKMNVGPCVVYDDIPILIRIIQVKHGGLADSDTDGVYHYDHIFVDEAQDFGAVALKVLMSTVHSRTGVTIVGDKNQKIFNSTQFVAWEEIASDLGIPHSEVNNLTVSHRSEHEITRLCDWVLGETIVDSDSLRDEYMPVFMKSNSVDDLYEVLCSTLKQRYIDAPHKHHVVVCNWPNEVPTVLSRIQKFFQEHDVEAPIRQGYKENFVFSAGITCTNRQQIKGLEFDSVFVFEPNTKYFEENELGRCSFYTVVSRPREYLGFFGLQEPCSLLSRAIQEGFVLDLTSHAFELDAEDFEMDF